MSSSPPKRLEDLSLVQRDRLAYIDFRLYFFGEIGRPDLIERFGVAPAGATRDLALYREIVPHNITFDGSNKIYRIGQEFSPLFEHASLRILSALSLGFGDGVAIDEACVRIIAKRQPTASDLRLVMVISKTIAELERIGDVADKICRTALEKFSQQHQPLLVSLESLGRHTIQMLHDVLDAFARMDIDEAVRIYREDKKVDQEYEGIVRQLMTYMMEDSRTIPSVLTALFCARSIERIGDRCQNICEFIFYYVKGQDFRHVGGDELDKLLAEKDSDK